MKTQKKLMLVLIAILLSTSVAGSCKKHPADTAAKFIVPGTEGYFQVQEQLLNAYDAGVPLVVANWTKIDSICDQADVQYQRIWKIWRAVSVYKTPENEQQLVVEIAKLTAIIPTLREYLK